MQTCCGPSPPLQRPSATHSRLFGTPGCGWPQLTHGSLLSPWACFLAVPSHWVFSIAEHFRGFPLVSPWGWRKLVEIQHFCTIAFSVLERRAGLACGSPSTTSASGRNSQELVTGQADTNQPPVKSVCACVCVEGEWSGACLFGRVSTLWAAPACLSLVSMPDGCWVALKSPRCAARPPLHHCLSLGDHRVPDPEWRDGRAWRAWGLVSTALLAVPPLSFRLVCRVV